MDIKSYKLLLIFINITSLIPLIVAVTKTVYFHKKSDCDAYRHYIEPGEIYEVVWNGEVYPKLCSIRFKMRDIDTYKLCAKVTLFNLECERHGDEARLLEFYYSVSLKERTYDCHAQLPISYCNEDILYVRLKPNWNDIRTSNSQIRITVTSTLLHKYGEKYSTKSSGSGVIVGIVVGMIVLIIGIVVCIVVMKRRSAAMELQSNGTTYTIQRQGNNVFIATPNTRHPCQHNSVEQQVPLVEYSGAGRTQPGSMDQNRYPVAMHPGYYGDVQPTAPPQNYYEEHPQNPSHVGPNSQFPEVKNITSVPPPSYDDVMDKRKNYGNL